MKDYDIKINKIREFNRFYTVYMEFLAPNYLNSQYSIAETRTLFEIKSHGTRIQSDIAKTIRIDKSYLSRIIKKFHKNGLIEQVKCDKDKRATIITLTEKGNAETAMLTALANKQIESKIKKLSDEECNEICIAFDNIISILTKEV